MICWCLLLHPLRRIIKNQNLYIPHWKRTATPTIASFSSSFSDQVATQHAGRPPPAVRRRAGLRTGGEMAMEKKHMLVWLISAKPKKIIRCSNFKLSNFQSFYPAQCSNVQSLNRCSNFSFPISRSLNNILGLNFQSLRVFTFFNRLNIWEIRSFCVFGRFYLSLYDILKLWSFELWKRTWLKHHMILKTFKVPNGWKLYKSNVSFLSL